VPNITGRPDSTATRFNRARKARWASPP